MVSHETDNYDDIGVLVVRTDYSDDGAWRAVLSMLRAPSDNEKLEPRRRIVDNTIFADSTPESVVSTVLGPSGSGVVFVADAATMCGGSHPLLAITPLFRDDVRLDEESRQMLRFGNVCRLTPTAATDMVINLAAGTLRFWEFARAADSDPERIYRGFLDVSHRL